MYITSICNQQTGLQGACRQDPQWSPMPAAHFSPLLHVNTTASLDLRGMKGKAEYVYGSEYRLQTHSSCGLCSYRVEYLYQM